MILKIDDTLKAHAAQWARSLAKALRRVDAGAYNEASHLWREIRLPGRRVRDMLCAAVGELADRAL